MTSLAFVVVVSSERSPSPIFSTTRSSSSRAFVSYHGERRFDPLCIHRHEPPPLVVAFAIPHDEEKRPHHDRGEDDDRDVAYLLNWAKRSLIVVSTRMALTSSSCFEGGGDVDYGVEICPPPASEEEDDEER